MIINEFKYNNIDLVMTVKELRDDTAIKEIERKNVHYWKYKRESDREP